MRRLFGSLSAVVLLSALVAGCHHTAGVCDCCMDCHNCGSFQPAEVAREPLPAAPAPVQQPPVISLEKMPEVAK